MARKNQDKRWYDYEEPRPHQQGPLFQRSRKQSRGKYDELRNESSGGDRYNRVGYNRDFEEDYPQSMDDYGMQGSPYSINRSADEFYERKDLPRREIRSYPTSGRRSYRDVGDQYYGERPSQRYNPYSNAGYRQNEYYEKQRINEPRNMYGGDTSNYGNANQGAFDRDWWQKTKDEVTSWFGRKEEDEYRRRKEIHRGKGPKGYQRSQERIREDVCERLTEDDMLDASNIEVQVQENEVILSGTVHSRADKRRAEDLVDSVHGVKNVENRIHVNPEGWNSRSDDLR